MKGAWGWGRREGGPRVSSGTGVWEEGTGGAAKAEGARGWGPRVASEEWALEGMGVR